MSANGPRYTPDVGKASRRKNERHVRRPSTTGKISARLIEVMQPYRRECNTLEAYEKLAALASAAWNISLLPKNERQSMLARVLDIFPPADREYALSIILALEERKTRLFPDDQRFVAGTEVIDEGSHFRIVAATISA